MWLRELRRLQRRKEDRLSVSSLQPNRGRRSRTLGRVLEQQDTVNVNDEMNHLSRVRSERESTLKLNPTAFVVMSSIGNESVSVGTHSTLSALILRYRVV